MVPEYKLSIDINTNQILYSGRNAGHAKPQILEEKELSNSPELLDKLSGRDAYMLGMLFASKTMGKLELIKQHTDHKYLVFFAIMFTSLMFLSNILSTKLIEAWGITIPGASLIYPFSYIFDYIITDIYGYQNARRVMHTTILALCLFDLSIYVLLHTQPSPYWPFQSQFELIFGKMLRTFCASTVAFAISFFASSYVLQKSKIHGDPLFKRIFKALLISEVLDTGLFCLIAFYGVWPIREILSFMIISYAIDITYELIVYKLITEPVINLIKRLEKLDIADYNTKFTPFSWRVTYTKENNLYQDQASNGS